MITGEDRSFSHNNQSIFSLIKRALRTSEPERREYLLGTHKPLPLLVERFVREPNLHDLSAMFEWDEVFYVLRPTDNVLKFKYKVFITTEDGLKLESIEWQVGTAQAQRALLRAMIRHSPQNDISSYDAWKAASPDELVYLVHANQVKDFGFAFIGEMLRAAELLNGNIEAYIRQEMMLVMLWDNI